MKLQFEIRKNNRIILRLAGKGENAGVLFWEDNNSLSRTLLQKIDQILKKKKIAFDNIREYKIISDVPENWTSARIAKITLESLGIAALAKKNKLC
ncbi:MAG: hypothetical protein PHP25_03345 [Candidatus Moranbacteria bacterium]|nr:hypothetical protein [Candidatus Moranbacteria bacterium]